MTKSTKSTATIRRRRQMSNFARLKTSRCTASTLLEEQNMNKHGVFGDIIGSRSVQKILSSDRSILLGLLVIRTVNALLIQTYFVPDEFWQSVEVAHNMAFNYGYMTWEWQLGIRSYTYPLVFATLYRVLRFLGLDYRILLIKLPRLLQGIFACMGDLYLFYLSRRLAGIDVARWTLLCQTLSWFIAYCCTRTLTNSAEAALVTAALYYFPWPRYTQSKGHTRRFVWLAAISVVVRPTAGIIWLLLCSWHLQQTRGPALFSTLRLYFTSGLTVLGIAAVIDRIWYGRWVFVLFNFLNFNVMTGGSAFYGSHPWHWYFSQGLPSALGPHLLPFLLGAWQAGNKVLLLLIIWTVSILSLLSHKEVRFLLPILPLAMHYCGVFFHNLSAYSIDKRKPHEAAVRGACPTVEKTCDLAGVQDESIADRTHELTGVQNEPVDISLLEEKQNKDCTTDSSERKCSGSTFDTERKEVSDSILDNERKASGSILDTERKQVHKVKYFVILLALTNLLPLLYFCLIHQRGSVDVMNYLHDSVVKTRWNSTSPSAVDILFLMPCHSTPFYSFLHANVSMRFLTCNPNINLTSDYIDEAEIFYQDPKGWLQKEYGGQEPPTHIVYFSCLQDDIKFFLEENDYKHCATFFHTHFPEGRVGSYVLVSCK